jgi:hypothetical protein
MYVNGIIILLLSDGVYKEFGEMDMMEPILIKFTEVIFLLEKISLIIIIWLHLEMMMVQSMLFVSQHINM